MTAVGSCNISENAALAALKKDMPRGNRKYEFWLARINKF